MDALGRIFESTEQINAIITTLIDISSASMSTQGLISDNVDIAQIALKLETEFKPLAIEKGLEFLIDFPDGLTMLSDEKKVYSLVHHLVDNAIKFSDGGEVTIEVDRSEQSQIRFAVSDQGAGVDPEILPRIFERFRKDDRKGAMRSNSTGLGLAISKELVELMGGRIGVDSVQGEGSTFWFVLPLRQRNHSISAMLAKNGD